MRRVAIFSLACAALFVVGCDDPNASNYDPMGEAADDAEMVLTDVPLDQIEACVDATKFGAYVGDADSQARWDAAGQSVTNLTHACTEIGRNDPKALAAMQAAWLAEQASLAAKP